MQKKKKTEELLRGYVELELQLLKDIRRKTQKGER